MQKLIFDKKTKQIVSLILNKNLVSSYYKRVSLTIFVLLKREERLRIVMAHGRIS